MLDTSQFPFRLRVNSRNAHSPGWTVSSIAYQIYQPIVIVSLSYLIWMTQAVCRYRRPSKKSIPRQNPRSPPYSARSSLGWLLCFVPFSRSLLAGIPIARGHHVRDLCVPPVSLVFPADRPAQISRGP